MPSSHTCSCLWQFFWLIFSRPCTLSKLCQADGVDDRSFSVAFLLRIVMRLSYLGHWNSYLLTSFSGSIALFRVHGSTLHLMGQISQVFTVKAINYSLSPVLLLGETGVWISGVKEPVDGFLQLFLIFFFNGDAPIVMTAESHGSGWERELIFWQRNNILICWCQQWFFIVLDTVLTGCLHWHQLSLKLHYYSYCTSWVTKSFVANRIDFQWVVCVGDRLKPLLGRFYSEIILLTPWFKGSIIVIVELWICRELIPARLLKLFFLILFWHRLAWMKLKLV